MEHQYVASSVELAKSEAEDRAYNENEPMAVVKSGNQIFVVRASEAHKYGGALYVARPLMK